MGLVWFDITFLHAAGLEKILKCLSHFQALNFCFFPSVTKLGIAALKFHCWNCGCSEPWLLSMFPVPLELRLIFLSAPLNLA